MIILKIILLFIGYTVGIVTFSVQFICYLKEIEYKETLFLNGAFLINIILFGLYEFHVFDSPGGLQVYDFMLSICTLVLAVTIPINMHKERIVKNEQFKSKLFLFIGLGLFPLLIISLIFGFEEELYGVTSSFLIIGVVYSMYLSIKTKPSLLVKHREKQEQRYARFFIVFVPIYFAFGMLNRHYNYMDVSLFDGTIIITLIFIALATSKLTDDIKRLSLFNSVGQKELATKVELYGLTAREEEVANLLMSGFSYNQIGESLFISLPTVKTHVSNIYKKTNSKNKVELINLMNN